jgi:hypothetical protein
MRALRFLFSPFGRLRPRGFVWAVTAVYVAGAASHLLTSPEVLARGGVWPFAALQALLVWVWFVLHAKRLRDGGRGVWPAAGASILYALSVALLLIVAASLYPPLVGQGLDRASDPKSASALGLVALVSIIATLAGSSQYDLVWFVVAVLLVITLTPIIVALGVTVWAFAGPRGKTA